MTTDGLVTKTGTGHNEFNAMPDWLQVDCNWLTAANTRRIPAAAVGSLC